MNKDLAKFTASLLLFGSNGVVASYINLPSYDIVVLRTLLGAALLAALLVWSRRRAKRAGRSGDVAPTEDVADAGRSGSLARLRSIVLVSLSGAFMGISWLLLFEAYSLVGVGVSSLLYYCGPVLVMAFSPILFGERLTGIRVACFAVVLLGIVFVNSGGLGEGLSPQGLAYGVGSAVCLAALITLNKKAKGLDGLENSLIQLVSAAIVALVGTAALHGISIDVQATDIPAILMLGLVNTGLGCYLYFGSLGALKAQTVAVMGYIEPVSAVVMAMAFLGESMSALQIIGAVLVVAGAAATELYPLFRQYASIRRPHVRIPRRA